MFPYMALRALPVDKPIEEQGPRPPEVTFDVGLEDQCNFFHSDSKCHWEGSSPHFEVLDVKCVKYSILGCSGHLRPLLPATHLVDHLAECQFGVACHQSLLHVQMSCLPLA